METRLDRESEYSSPGTLHSVPYDLTARYGKLAEKAKTQPQAAIKLKCLDCCGWEYTEAQRCGISGCSLYPFNRRIFKARPKKESACG